MKRMISLITALAIVFSLAAGFPMTASAAAEALDLTGEWSIVGNGCTGKFDVNDQDGNEFTGTVNYSGSGTQMLINGSLSGDNFTFTRMWDSGSLRQDYTGMLTIDSNGKATVSGTFTQNGSGSYKWTASKTEPIAVSTMQAPSTPTVNNSEAMDLTGEWTIRANNCAGKFNIANQQGTQFTGTVNIDAGRTESLTNGNISGDTVSFIRQWNGSTLRQEYTGTLTIDSNGKATISGTFTQNGKGSYNWTASKVNLIGTSTIISDPPSTEIITGGATSEAFESGARVSWEPTNGLGYRMFRSTSKSNLGISVTDFYITSTSYADVNVEPDTTYYYTVKPVLAEAKPFDGIDEKLGAAIATFTVKTGSQVYKPGSFKHFIMLKLDDPKMSVDGASHEVDPGRGTSPMTISGRTMVPIRAVVEAMGGTVGWDGSTQKITLTARGNVVEMWMGKTDIKINGVSKKMDVAPASKNSRTFVPVRFAAENLNCKVDWINSTKEAVIVYEE